MISREDISSTLATTEDVVNSFFDGDTLLVDGRDYNGMTLMHYAAENGRVDWINKLVELGSPANVIDSAGNTPIHIAVHRNREWGTHRCCCACEGWCERLSGGEHGARDW